VNARVKEEALPGTRWEKNGTHFYGDSDELLNNRALLRKNARALLNVEGCCKKMAAVWLGRYRAALATIAQELKNQKVHEVVQF